MSSSLTSSLIGATSSVGAAASGAPWWVIVVLSIVGLLPVLLRECRTWRVDHHDRAMGRWAEDRIRRTEIERQALHIRIAEEIGQLPDGQDRIELYIRLLDKSQLNVPAETPPQPGEGAANSP
ncbi:hypothetical protein PV343_13495 [Streptomyces sp. WI03-4A]|uniref:hypothetical protein n=1 Tax=Streptomyces sp. WI03-4A TaxID=3028706 RepID=UPI0029A8F145|nr:hypothetical protein [Streptomyces sp. WI03-4A]MDX2593243.1 hypothetical protein [Streptomyces sp. WI03-4A]